jgi:aspartate/methionine/tyrosine aminotransferase
MTTQILWHQSLLDPRMSRLGTETAFEVPSKAMALERRERGSFIWRSANPDFETPSHIVEAAATALHTGWTHMAHPQACRNCAGRLRPM